MDGVYKLLNREFCQKNQELKILLDREHRINADLQNELRQGKIS